MSFFEGKIICFFQCAGFVAQDSSIQADRLLTELGAASRDLSAMIIADCFSSIAWSDAVSRQEQAYDAWLAMIKC